MKHIDSDGSQYFVLHEVHYNEDGSLKSYSAGARGPFGETEEELSKCMLMMKAALLRPVLTEEDFR